MYKGSPAVRKPGQPHKGWKAAARQRYRSPDGLDWRDPEMPLARKDREIDPAKLTQVCQMTMVQSPEPDWRNDPIYNLRKDRYK